MHANISCWQSLKTRVTCFTLAIFLISTWSMAFYASEMLRKDIEGLLGDQQLSTVSLLAEELNHELADRMRVLGEVAARVSPATLDHAAALQSFLEERLILKGVFNAGVIAFAPDGTAIAAVPLSAGAIGTSYMDIDTVAAALNDGKSTIGRPLMGKQQQAPVFGMTVPIRDGQGKVIGALGGVVDLSIPNFLDSIVQSRYGRTGGYVLVAPQHRLVVTATDKSRSMASLPAPGDNPTIDRFVEGFTGPVVYVSSFGVEILASAKRLPVAGWQLLAILPTAEAFAPIRTMQRRMLLGTILLTLLMGFLNWRMLRQQLSPLLAAAKAMTALNDAKHPRQPLPIFREDEIGRLVGAFNQLLQTLTESEELLRLFIKYAPAGLAMFDSNMRYLLLSNRWLADHGLGDCDLHGLCHYDVFPEIPEEWREAHRRGLAGEVLRSDGDRFEKLDGSVRWLRWELRPWYNARQTIGGIVIFTEDITAYKNAEAALRQSEERLSLVLRGTQDGFWDWDLVQNRIYYSPRWWQMLGYADGELHADSDLWRYLTHPDDLERVEQAFAAALAANADSCEIEFRLRHQDGHYLDVCSRAIIVRDEQGKAIRVAGANMDLELRKRAENVLREQVQFFRLIAENLQGFVAVLDAEGRRLYNSPSYVRLLGARNISGTSSFADIHPADRERVMRAFRDTVDTGIGHHLEYRFLIGDGSVRLLESRGGVIRDNQGRTKFVVVVSHDVTERKESEEKIHRLAFYDALTQLPNRLTLNDRLSQAMAANKRSGCYGALMFLDLDNFKPVNDNYGHEVGDWLLIEVADRLRTCMRAMDTVARFGGDEFVVMLSDLNADKVESMLHAQIVAEKIRITLSESYRLTVKREGQADTTIEHRCTASIGVALFRHTDVSRDDILKWADMAMYQAKEAGGNLIRFYDTKA